MKVLDLCSGLEGWSAPWRERGHDVTTLDYDPIFNPTIVQDVRDAEFPRGSFDVVLASPPCELFSTAGWHRHAWRMDGAKARATNTYTPVKPEAFVALAIVRAVLRIIIQIEPQAAVIENPRALLRQLQVVPFAPQTVWYCHYGERRAKPTDLWTFGAARWMRLEPECHNRRPGHAVDCCCVDHVSSPRGSVTGTQGMSTAEAGRIPLPLAESVCDQLEAV